jgi:DNA repair exonuclease SbcCD nuclease subunit
LTVRLLHTADWQLGKPFHQIEGDAAAVIREARFAAVRRLATLAAEHRLDAVLVAGDAFDGNLVPDRVVDAMLGCLEAFPGPWVFLPGNHDPRLSECVWTRLRRRSGERPDLVLVEAAEPLPLAGGRLVILPSPLLAKRIYEDVTAWMDGCDTPAGAVRVGLAHGSVREHLPPGLEPSNPIAADRAARARLDYLALGDWHGTRRIDDRTWYAGTPEPDRHHDNEPGHALLVEIEGPGAMPRVTRLATAHHRWQALEIACAGLATGEPAAYLTGRLEAIEDRERTVLALRLTGTLSLGDRAMVDEVLERAAARFRYLEVDAEDLLLEPGAADLADLRDGGVLDRVLDRLRDELGSAEPEHRERAASALRLFWSLARKERA